MASASGRSHVFVGAARVGSHSRGGLFRQAVGNGHWEQLTKGVPDPVDVQAITVHPTQPDLIYLGTRSGLYRSMDGGERWERLGVPEGVEVWSVLVHPSDPRRLYEVWEGTRFPSSREKAHRAFMERFPSLIDRVDFSPHRRISRASHPDQLPLFE